MNLNLDGLGMLFDPDSPRGLGRSSCPVPYRYVDHAMV